MNTCMVCGGVIPEQAGNCPYCGEYAIQVIGTCNDEAMRRLEQKAAAKRRKLLEGIALPRMSWRSQYVTREHIPYPVKKINAHTQTGMVEFNFL